MSKLKNLTYLFIFGGILLALKFLLIDKVFSALPKDANLWFTSGLLLVILGIFITEKYFTRSLDVIVNVITVMVVLLTLDQPHDFRLWGALLTYSIIIGSLALTSFVIYDEEKDQNSPSQRIAGIGSTIARFLGSSRMLFSIVFILSIFNYFVFSLATGQGITEQQISILFLIVFWGAMLLIEPIDRKLIQPLIEKMKNKEQPRIVGRVVKRMSPNIVVTEELAGVPLLAPGDIVALDDIKQTHRSKSHHLVYLYSQDTEDKRHDFFYSLNPTTEAISEQVYVHSLNSEEQEKVRADFSDDELIKNRANLIGFVHAGSDIDVLKIKMIDGVDEKRKIKEGDLVSATFYDCPTKYQIINVETATESVEGSSKQGGKIITAQQIGFWQPKEQQFEGNGWVPEINTPVFIETPDGEIAPLGGGYYRVGVIPSSTFPIYINLEESVTHHIAVIGKTGTGKSRMSARMIEHLAACSYKVVVLEIDQKNSQSLSERIAPDKISAEKTVWSSEEKNKNVGSKSVTYKKWEAKTNLDPADGKNIFVINWDNDSRNHDDGPLNQTDAAAAVITDVVQYQIKNPDKKTCIVLEEAYDFIPESTFGQQDFGQPGVSRISQLVLKCRKHNIGFFIITQRTALVSKTILNQCQTILALQSFDETTRIFMGSYINQKYLDSMSILRRFTAIVVGKGSTCDKPVIVNFFDKKAVEEHDKKTPKRESAKKHLRQSKAEKTDL